MFCGLKVFRAKVTGLSSFGARESRPARYEIARAKRASARIVALRSGLALRAATTADIGRSGDETPVSVSRSKARSWAEWKRCSGFFSRQWRTIRSSPGEIFRLVSERSGGSSRRIADIVSAVESAWKARRPESISYRIAPKEKMSERASADLPLTCSGDM